ncbi:probable ATP-dependent DNA helicase CHR12 [Rhododendron vialii]|uniref:probable ATP-dependent DNA helicase CHR12 n=1 Tax=Rhododendron vialii TaxID=182163 RepID=UPI00265DFA6D|nr:probable ATP-dependent DNA helicase CHR12 [Rhododendron vialii]
MAMAQVETQPQGSLVDDDGKDDCLEKAKTLICALNLLSRNLPLSQDIFDAVSSIYDDVEDEVDDVVEERAGGSNVGVGDKNGLGILKRGNLIIELEDALVKQRPNCLSGSGLTESRDKRLQSHIQHRLAELEELPSSRGEDLQSKCLHELYGLKLSELQSKVRSDVSSEYWLRVHCAYPESQLFDWGMMRLRRPLYGVGDAFDMAADDNLKKKRDVKRLSRLQEQEKNLVETRKRKFFAELLDATRELQLQIQAAQRRRKQRNDGVQAWHGRQRQRATRAEKLRFQALKSDDQEAYMRMVEESKNERLTMLLGKTNELLVRLGAAVQRQKDAGHDGIEPLKDSDADLPELPASNSETPGDSIPEEDADIVHSESSQPLKTGDLLEGQRQYNSVIHAIEEMVTEQPSTLQGGELRPYQIEGLQWMLSLFNNNLNGILADEMGLGKTIQTIALIAYLIENKGVTGPHLIVAPKAVLPNWVNEFSSWAPSIMAVLYDGRLDERKAMREEYSGEGKFNVLITHYDLIMRDKAFLKKIHWQYMIVDEGHRLKNHECALARTLVSGYRIRRRLLLTGTPIQNSLQELWSLLNFLLPNIFNSVQNFEEWFNAPFADRCDVSLNDEEELLIIRRLHHVIRPFILRRKKDEVEKYLPGKTQVILKCDMSSWQKVYYQQVTDVGRVGLDSRSGKSKSLQNLTMQLRKCCNHPYLFVGEYNVWRKEEIVRASGKFELLDRLLPKLHKAGHRVLLFSQMTRLMDILEIYLQLHDFKYLRLDGSTKTEERGTLLKQFNAPDSPFFMFLLSTRAGGLGLNLQTADTVIIFDSDWNPQMDQQAEDRAHRIGQKKEVRVFVLVSVGSIEEVILERAKQKKGIDAKVIQAGLFNTTSTAQDRREMLKEIMHRGTSSLGTDVPSEREINRLAARSEEEFWLFEKMDEERRRKENYRSRLMEEHEVPEWAYTTPDNKESKGKGFDYESKNLSGKRKRKEVVYMDAISDTQWMKNAENGLDMTRNSVREKRREILVRGIGNEVASNSQVGKKKVRVVKIENLKHENVSMVSKGTTEDTLSLNSNKSNIEVEFSQKTEEGERNVLLWKVHKRKRSRLVS